MTLILGLIPLKLSMSMTRNSRLLKIRVWHDLHFRSCAKHPMSLVLVERLKEDGSARVAKPLWLAWVGEQMPILDEVWRLYLRRFAIDQRQSISQTTPALDIA